MILFLVDTNDVSAATNLVPFMSLKSEQSGKAITLFRCTPLILSRFCFAQQRERLPLARKELHALLEDPELQKMPLLVLGNKIDLEPHMSKEEIIKGLNLDYIQDQPWECMAISGLRGMGVERVIDWLIAHARK